MKSRLHLSVTILCLAAILLSLVNPLLVAADSPVKIPLDSQVEPNSAMAAKLEAIRLVEEMRYPDPDLASPRKDLRKQYILLELRASIDGTFRSYNYLQDGTAFEHDVNAAKRLRDMLADPKIDDTVRELATQALQEIVSADRLVTAKALEATTVFGPDQPKAGADGIERAQQELAKGDDKAGKGMAVDAIRDYQKAWEYATEAIDLIWAAQDPDGDLVIGWIEERLGTDPDLADTDGDGIDDGKEFTEVGTDPTKADSDGDDISDAAQDLDGDGLSNLQEVTLETNPLRADSDGEGLDDGFEVNTFDSDPLKQDTDDDALTDDSEYRLGTDPRNPDSDGDGIPDGLETYTSILTGDDGAVVVELTGMGDVARETTVRNLSDDTRFQGLPGQLSAPMQVTAEAPFDTARIKLRFDPAQVPNGDYDGLRILYYDETARTFFSLGAYGVDAENGYAWAETTHFTVFVLFYIPNWETAWTHPMYTGRDGEDPEMRYLDVMLILDSSGSMAWNDPSGYRRIAAKRFIDALLEGDRVGVIDFDYYGRLYQGLTTDFAAAKAAVDRVDSSGGTDIRQGVGLANQELINNGDPEHLKVEILLTDGVGSYNPSLTAQAVDAGIVIYTIGLGYDVDEALLRSIAQATGGLYFPVASAEQLPDVFQRIVGGDIVDDDNDGIPDQLETDGIRTGNGDFVYTDPTLWDSDGDNLSDGEELGALLSSPWGNYFETPSSPVSVDSDGDGLLDWEEEDIGTSPYRADSDGDGLGDLIEVDNDFDPNDKNPDGDDRDDYDEWVKDSDPFHYDPNALEYALQAVAGFVLGEAGENLANIGWVDHETIRSLTYLAGWLASNAIPFGLGDLRDTLASLVRGDVVDTLLNAMGLIPMLGDGLDAARDVAKWLGWSEDLFLPLTRWLVKTFGTSGIMTAVLKVVGYSDELGMVLSKGEIATLGKYRNDLGVLDKLLKQGVRIAGKTLDDVAWTRVASRVNDPALWDLTKLSANATMMAEARAVEAAVEMLGDGYEILYVGRNLPLDMVDGTTKFLSKGPDIVAINKATHATVVIEVKGAVDNVVLSGRRIHSTVGGTSLVQTSRAWLATNYDRYLKTMRDAADGDIRAAAQRLEDIIFANGSYESVIIGYGKGAASRFGKIDEALKTLSSDVDKLQMILIKP